MPQLPSGRHAGLRPKNLEELVENAFSGSAVHQLLAIESVEDLMSHYEVTELIPVELGESQDDLRPGSLPFPGQFEQRSTGITLDRIAALSDLWPAEDYAAYAAFVKEDRVSKDLEWTLGEIKSVQDRLMTEGSTLAKMLTAWWCAGVHPAQEKGWEDMISPDYSEMEMIVALGVLADQIWTDELTDDVRALEAVLRLSACWTIVRENLSDLSAIRYEEAIGVRDIAAALRPLTSRDELPQSERTWISAQCKIVARDLWDCLGPDRLRAINPSACEILTLVMMAPADAESSRFGR